MYREIRQLATDSRFRIALAMLAASTLLVATAVPAPRVSMPQTSAAPPISSLVQVEPVATSVAALPEVEPTPAGGSAIPENAPTPPPPKLHAQPRPQRPQLSAASLCLSPGSNPECEAAFHAALASTLEPADVVVTASGSADIGGAHAVQPLHFQKRAPWVRRLETIGKEGIPFVRIPRGTDREFVVGINRKGVLGVSLRERHD